jgi:hypothetical protein
MAVLFVAARMVRGLRSDGSRPGAEVDLPFGGAGRSTPGGQMSTHAQGRRRSPIAPGSRSWEGPRQGGEILGLS